MKGLLSDISRSCARVRAQDLEISADDF